MNLFSQITHFIPFELDEERFSYFDKNRKPIKNHQIFIGTKVRPIYKLSKDEKELTGEGVITRSKFYLSIFLILLRFYCFKLRIAEWKYIGKMGKQNGKPLKLKA